MKHTHTHTHTPGPWSASINSQPLYTSAEIYGPPNGFGMVAEIRASFGPDDEKMANARLIAAAPELLAALSLMYCAGLWSADELASMPEYQRNAIESARLALAKAEGRA